MSLGRQRFSIIPAAAVTDRRLQPIDLAVLCLLGRHTDNNGWCCRSQVKMARELDKGRATIKRALERLVETRYVEHRPKWRDSGADAAHDYRVVIDVPEADQDRVPTGGQGVPTGGQGCPPKDGQGVPTHERAPRLTTPLNGIERERAGEIEKFEKARKAWPSGFADNREEALEAWLTLSPDDQAEASSEIGRFVSTTRAVGRKHFCSFGSYLRERRWEALPDKPKNVASYDISSGAHKQSVRPAVAKPTKFQLDHPELYPELFGEPACAAEEPTP